MLGLSLDVRLGRICVNRDVSVYWINNIER